MSKQNLRVLSAETKEKKIENFGQKFLKNISSKKIIWNQLSENNLKFTPPFHQNQFSIQYLNPFLIDKTNLFSTMRASFAFIPCTEHPGSCYNRIDPDPSSTKHLYCHECLFQSEDPTSRYKKFPNLLEFISNAAAIFEKNKPTIKSFNKPERAYVDIIDENREIIQKFTEHINEEKAKVEMLYDRLEKVIVETVRTFKKKHVELLDDQISQLKNMYFEFEMDLQEAYPNRDNVDSVLLSEKDLQISLGQISDVATLEGFIDKIKQDILQSTTGTLICSQSEEVKKMFFDEYIFSLREQEHKRPLAQYSFEDLDEARKEIKLCISQFFDKAFWIEDAIVSEGYTWKDNWQKFTATSALFARTHQQAKTAFPAFDTIETNITKTNASSVASIQTQDVENTKGPSERSIKSIIQEPSMREGNE